MRLGLKILFRSLLVLIALPLLLLLLLASETVNEWLFAKAQSLEPRLQLEYVSGDLWQGWQFAHIGWQDTALELQIEQLDFAWSPSCLFGMRLCIDRLHSQSITVVSQPTEQPEPSEPFTLPDLQLPLAIELGDVRIDRISLDGENALLSDLVLRADADGDRLVITRFSGVGPDLDWQLQGDLEMQQDWPLNLSGRVNLPPVDERDWQVDLAVGGALKQQLTLRLQSSGYLAGQLDGEVAALDPNLPASMHWRGESFLALNSLPVSLTLNNLALDAEGNLDDGFKLTGSSSLPGQGGEVQLQLDALASVTGISDAQLLLYVSEQPERKLELNAEANWADQLSADAQATLQQSFPWYWLYPQDLGEVVLQQLELQASLRGEQIDSDLSAQLSGVAGQTINLEMRAQGDQQALTVAPLKLSTEAGNLDGQVDLTLAPDIVWDGRFQLHDLNPGIFVAELPGKLNGELTSQGSLAQDVLQLQAQWDVDGTLRQQPLGLAGKLNKATEAWQVSDLLIRQGENRISGQGQWGPQVNGYLDVQLTQLATLWPELRGALTGRADFSGTEQAPGLSLKLSGETLAYAENQAERISLEGRIRLSDALPGNLAINASAIRSGDNELGDLTASVQGDRGNHSLAVDLSGGLASVSLQLRTLVFQRPANTDARAQG